MHIAIYIHIEIIHIQNLITVFSLNMGFLGDRIKRVRFLSSGGLLLMGILPFPTMSMFSKGHVGNL